MGDDCVSMGERVGYLVPTLRVEGAKFIIAQAE
jgi:hypothetical protein